MANLLSIWTIGYTTPSRYNWMFQYYLRAEGLALSWVGSGRLIFSHNYSDEDFEAVARRFVAAARAMQEDGWWWHAPSLTNATIRRQILREMLAPRVPASGCGLAGHTRLVGDDRIDPFAPETVAAAPCNTASHRETDR